MDQLREQIYEVFYQFFSIDLSTFLTTVTMIFIWLLLGFLITNLLKQLTHRIYTKSKDKLDANQRTAANLISTLINFFIWIYIVVMVLEELNINVVPVLASAGILAFAIGFGAQELIKDLISGFFIIFERSFHVGDNVTINNFTGEVVEIGIRKTKLRNWKNEYLLINNGDIRNIINLSLDDSIGVVELSFTMQTPVNWFYEKEFEQLLFNFSNSNDNIIEPAKVAGIIDNDRFIYRVRITFKTKNFTQHSIERDLRGLVIKYIEGKELE